MTTLNTLTNDQTLIAAEKIKLASGDIDSVFLAVEFDAAWDEYVNRSASFYTSFNSNVEEVLLTDDMCTVPSKMLEQEGTLFIGVIGVSADGKRVKTSTYTKYTLIKGAEHAFTTIKPTLDLYQQYLIAVDEKTAPIIVALQTNFESKYEALQTDFESKYEALLHTMSGVEVWENAAPSSSFPSQTIPLDLTEYKRVVVEFKDTYEATVCHIKGRTYGAWRHTSGGNPGRTVSFSDTGVTISTCSMGAISDNSYLIPTLILGYKY